MSIKKKIEGGVQVKFPLQGIDDVSLTGSAGAMARGAINTAKTIFPGDQSEDTGDESFKDPRPTPLDSKQRSHWRERPQI